MAGRPTSGLLGLHAIWKAWLLPTHPTPPHPTPPHRPPRRVPSRLDHRAQGLVGSVSRGTAHGLMVAATELMILARCDAFVRTGSRGYSSYSYVAANAAYRGNSAAARGGGAAAGPPPQYLVVHPCDEDKRWPRRDGTSAASPSPHPLGDPRRPASSLASPPIDCLRELHTQPRLNMWWAPRDTPAERGRASCALPLPDGTPSRQNLAQRLQVRPRPPSLALGGASRASL